MLLVNTAMKGVILVLAAVLLGGGLAVAQLVPPPAKGDRSAVEHGAQPTGDSPSAAAGRLVRDPVERRILGLPVSTALVVAGALLALLVLAGVVLPRARRRDRARGGGTYGPPR